MLKKTDIKMYQSQVENEQYFGCITAFEAM